MLELLKTPVYGLIPRDNHSFCDEELLGENPLKYVLKTIKLWYGTPISAEENSKDKNILGIQCSYQNLITKNIKTTTEYIGVFDKNKIELKEFTLKTYDYFTQFNIDFNGEVITHLKFKTKTGEIFEVGEENQETKIIVEFNDLKEGMIHSFFGYYNEFGIRSLGCNYNLRKDYILLDLVDLLWLKKYFKKNKEVKKKWENPENLDKLSFDMKAMVKLCLLSDAVFFNILKYFI